MTSSELTTWIRRLLLEETATYVSPEALAAAETDAITLLAELLVAASPDSFIKTVSLQPAHTYVPRYDFPSDCEKILNVFDMDGNSATVSGAADNGSGAIRLTHDGTFSDEDIVTVHDVGGTTEANGTWENDRQSSTTLDLVGSAFSNAYTSGGKIFKISDDTFDYPLSRRPLESRSADDENTYYYRGSQIVVDDPDFTNDLIVDYRYLPSTLSEIPSKLHMGIGAFCVLMLQQIPKPEHPSFGMVKKNRNLCDGIWNNAQMLARNYSPVIDTVERHKYRKRYFF